MFDSPLGAQQQGLEGLTGGQTQHFLSEQTVQPEQTIWAGNSQDGVFGVLHNSATQRNVSLDPKKVSSSPGWARMLGVSRIHALSAGLCRGFATR